MKKIILTGALLLVIVAGATFIASRNQNQTISDKLSVAASYYPLYDFAVQVGGQHVSVQNITPPGAEPHDYEPSPKTLADIQKADVFVYNGGHLEPWVDNFLQDYHSTAVKASNHIDMLATEDEDDPKQHIQDPHFWLDPVLAEQITQNITDGFSTADPAHRADYTRNAVAYKAKLAQLNTDFVQGLATCHTRTVISSHDAFSYLGKRYNLNIQSIAGLSPEEEPSPAKLAELSQLVKSKNIGYVFYESLVSSRLADTIATETGAKTLVFDPIEGLSDADQKQGKNYLSVQYENLKNLRTALACQ